MFCCAICCTFVALKGYRTHTTKINKEANTTQSRTWDNNGICTGNYSIVGRESQGRKLKRTHDGLLKFKFEERIKQSVVNKVYRIYKVCLATFLFRPICNISVTVEYKAQCRFILPAARPF